MNNKIIRAVYDEQTITVYQAFNKQIANSAVNAQNFVSPPFKITRMTWIKPSFLWMMYRSGWATKENQEFILAIKIKRGGFEWALNNSCLSLFEENIYSSHIEWKAKLDNSPVRIQWDPDRDLLLQPLENRAIQIGLSGIAVEKYIQDWIVDIENITDNCKNIHQLIIEGKINQAKKLIPLEKTYSLPEDIALKIGLIA